MATATLTFEELFDPNFLSALQSFSIRARRVALGGRHADHKSRKRGAGMEFADFKPYVAGDDLRAIDWNIYRRLGRIFVKVFDEQQDLPVYILMDTSKSMFFEDNPRIRSGLQTALALASISLGQHDSIGLFSFSDGLQTRARSTSGKRGLMTFARQLAALGEGDGSNLSDAVRQLANFNLRPGLLVVVSDFFDPAGVEAVTGQLKLTRHRLLLVQLVKDTDADPGKQPDMHGDLRLRDCESAGAVDVTITPAMLARYRAVYRQFGDHITDFAKTSGAGFVRLDTDKDVLEQLDGLFASGVLVV